MKTLRAILKEKGVNQKIVADALGVDITSIRRYDDLPKRSVEEVLKISEATGIDFTELTGVGVEKITSSFDNLGNINMGAVGGENLNNSRGVYNRGSIGGNIITGDNSTPKYDKDQTILILENEVKHLNELLAEKERFIQVLLKK